MRIDLEAALKRFVNRRSAAAAVVTVAILVPLGVLGAPALARSVSAVSQYGHSGSSQYQYKITICHRTHSKKHPFVQIRVSVHAWKGHKHHHGDTLGPCPSVPAPAAPTQHGHHGHGNGNDQGANSNSQGNDSHPGNNGNGKAKGHDK